MALTAEMKTKIENRLRPVGVWMIGALLVQIVVGMANNLWLDIPQSGGNDAWSSAAPMILLQSHLWVGTALTVFGTWLPIDAIRVKNRQWTFVSLIGVVLIGAAFGGGSAFLTSGGSDDASSFMMAISCVLALAVYLAPFLRKAKAV